MAVENRGSGSSDTCDCGHDRESHTGPIQDCQGRCLCNLCSDETVNECWCAGFKP